ncbi:MAG: ATP-binding cassette domain-containing protein [Clostridia bacterium]|nr:ATP-binding cassette domain-containing protein [Clostridia bacterium]
MISIQNLTKKYKSKNKFDCVALDNISFDLPDSGMVFILGKSGSGKSTLLNLIGGGVFPKELIANYIKTKRAELAEMAKIPTPAEFDKYYNL